MLFAGVGNRSEIYVELHIGATAPEWVLRNTQNWFQFVKWTVTRTENWKINLYAAGIDGALANVLWDLIMMFIINFN